MANQCSSTTARLHACEACKRTEPAQLTCAICDLSSNASEITESERRKLPFQTENPRCDRCGTARSQALLTKAYTAQVCENHKSIGQTSCARKFALCFTRLAYLTALYAIIYEARRSQLATRCCNERTRPSVRWAGWCCFRLPVSAVVFRVWVSGRAQQAAQYRRSGPRKPNTHSRVASQSRIQRAHSSLVSRLAHFLRRPDSSRRRSSSQSSVVSGSRGREYVTRISAV